MEIWIEQVLIDNLIINSLILITTVKLLKIKISKWKIFISALVGSIFSLLMPLIVLPNLIFIFIKLLIGLTMVLILQQQKTQVKKIFLCYMAFIFLTFLYGGVCYGIIILINSNCFNANNSLIYNYNFPISLIVLICFLTFYLIIKMIEQIYRKKSVNNFIYKINLIYNNKKFCASAFFDSGNKLIDDKTNKPIIIISLNLSQQIFEDVNLINLITGSVKNNVRFKEISTTGKKQKIIVKEVDKVEIFFENKMNTFNNVPLGLLFKNFNDCLDYDCLIGPDYVQ